MNKSDYKAGTNQSRHSECLSDLQLASLLDNSLKAVERQVLIKHLNRCENCRFCWMEASSYIDSNAAMLNTSSWRDWLGKLAPITFLPARPTTGIAVMATVVFCVVMLLPLQSGVEPLLDEQYAQLTGQQYALDAEQAMKDMALPWEHVRLGFAPPHTQTSQLFFAAGLLEGRNTLAKDSRYALPAFLTAQLKDTSKSGGQRGFYQLGRWLVPLWFISQFEQDVDWNQQEEILQQFYSHFGKINTADAQATHALQMLQRLEIALKDVQQNPYAQDNFQRQVERVMIQLSPDSLNE